MRLPRPRCLLVVLCLAVGSRRAAAQRDSVLPTQAFGIGYSPAAGALGVEWVTRSFPRAPRLGGAHGAGVAGIGARLNVALRDPAERRRVPYVGAGYMSALWLPVLKLSGITSVEGGVQFWPAPGHDFYMDLGAGVALLSGTGHSGDVGPVLRLLFGRTF